MKRRLLLSSFTLCCLLLNPLRAADANAEAKPNVPSSAAAATDPAWINIDFPGGTIAQLITAIAKSGGTFNVIGEKADLDTVLPAFSLRHTHPDSLAGALDALLKPRGLGIAGNMSNGPYVVRRLERPPYATPGSTLFMSFQLAPYLGERTEGDIIEAIRIAWALDPEHRPEQLRLQYHPGTTLLLVSGPSEGIAIVSQIIGALPKPSPAAGKPGGPPGLPVPTTAPANPK